MSAEFVKLAQEHATRARQRASELGRPVLLSVSVAAHAGGEPLALLQSALANDGYAFLWQRPADRFALAGIGALAVATGEGADRFRSVATACRRCVEASITAAIGDPEGAGPIFMGGFAFAPEGEISTAWQAFPRGRMVLPHMQVAWRGSSATLTLNVLLGVDAAPDDVARELALRLARVERALRGGEETRENGTTSLLETMVKPDPRDWRQAVVQTIADIRARQLEKLVLARECQVRCDGQVHPHHLVRHLRHAYPTCTTFLVDTPGGSFVGATPERLVALEGDAVRTAAIAGSIARSDLPAKDRELGQRLLHDRKERQEHALVVKAIEESLTPLCFKLDIAAEPDLMRLENVQHLITPIAGRLSRACDVLALVERLHPSPAVGGYPRAAALKALRERESLERGWYAGPVGWMNTRGEGDFAVAVRSALVRGKAVTLYAGAGIVEGSDPDAELAEVRLKMQPLLSALTDKAAAGAREGKAQRLAS